MSTIASSVALRLRHLAGKIHVLGPAPLYHLMRQLVGGADPLPTLENYARLPADFIKAYGGDRLPSPFVIPTRATEVSSS
jgi:hypothetical protein